MSGDSRAQRVFRGQQIEAVAGSGLGVAEAPDSQEGLAQYPVGLGELGIEGDGLLKVVDGLIELTPGVQDQTEIVMRRRQLRVDPEGVPEVVDGLVRLPRLHQDDAEVGVGQGKLGVGAQDLAIMLDDRLRPTPWLSK